MYTVYIDGFCVWVGELKEEAIKFLNYMEEQGYGGYILFREEKLND